jgi:hypothetical protein
MLLALILALRLADSGMIDLIEASSTPVVADSGSSRRRRTSSQAPAAKLGAACFSIVDAL